MARGSCCYAGLGLDVRDDRSQRRHLAGHDSMQSRQPSPKSVATVEPVVASDSTARTFDGAIETKFLAPALLGDTEFLAPALLFAVSSGSIALCIGLPAASIVLRGMCGKIRGGSAGADEESHGGPDPGAA